MLLMACMVELMLPSGGRRICMIQDMLPGLDPFYTDPAHLITACEDIHDLDHDLSYACNHIRGGRDSRESSCRARVAHSGGPSILPVARFSAC